jgi:hypothetical protein
MDRSGIVSAGKSYDTDKPSTFTSRCASSGKAQLTTAPRKILSHFSAMWANSAAPRPTYLYDKLPGTAWTLSRDLMGRSNFLKVASYRAIAVILSEARTKQVMVWT